jgi:hypothetical protein
MKRAAWKIVILSILLFALSLTFVTQAVWAELSGTTYVLVWVNQLRAGQNLSQLKVDPLLEQTAEAYAADLAERRILSHVDELGRRALERFRVQGGTTVLIGEILGSGPRLPEVAAAWAESPSHREVMLNPLWTHCGAAAVRAGETAVWVVLFTNNRVDPLQILLSTEGYLIRGRLNPDRAAEPVLFSGILPIDPLDWDPDSGEFSYLIPRDREGIFHRLGYRSRGGEFTVTNTFFPEQAVTFDPGKERR